jgi:hypothetical protein
MPRTPAFCRSRRGGVRLTLMRESQDHIAAHCARPTRRSRRPRTGRGMQEGPQLSSTSSAWASPWLSAARPGVRSLIEGAAESCGEPRRIVGASQAHQAGRGGAPTWPSNLARRRRLVTDMPGTTRCDQRAVRHGQSNSDITPQPRKKGVRGDRSSRWSSPAGTRQAKRRALPDATRA